MRFDISHELDVPVDTLELALMSPELAARLAERVDSMDSIAVVSHEVSAESIKRVWRFQAKAPLRVLSAYQVTREMMIWDEVWSYDRKTHVASFHIVPRPGVDPDANWRKRIDAGGTYQLDPLADGRTRRSVSGQMSIDLTMIGPVVERVAVAELKKAYAAEADALASLCSLP
jgi:hypothetical protein